MLAKIRHWRHLFVCLAIFMVLGSTAEVQAGATPSQWVIVVNGQSTRSRTIANYYTYWRNIPTTNVIALDDVPTGVKISLTDFKDRILNPILKEIEKRKLAAHIQGIAYSSDFPLSVDFSAETKPQGPQAQFITPIGSLTGLTYLHRLVNADGNHYMALGNNFYAQRPAAALLGPISGDPENETEKKIAAYREAEDHYRLAELLDEELKKNPFQFPLAYASAQAWSMAGESAKALQRLQQAIESGWSYSKFTQEDSKLERLREYSRFQALVRACEDDVFDWTPVRAFDARKFYYPNGVGGFTPGGGVNYYLSFALAVGTDLGNSQGESLQQLKTSISADFTLPKGVFYFSKTDDIRTQCREGGFKIANDRLKALGYESEIISDPVPTSKTCMGVTIGVPGFDWKKTQSTLVAGALGDNLTSWGGAMDVNDQTKLTEFLRNGAAAASGTVYEPYAIGAKFPHPTLHASYAAGLTAAEAFYASVAGPYQLLIAGDPLCQPFAKPPRFDVEGIQDGMQIRDRAQVDFKASSEANSVKPRTIALLLDGQFQGLSPFPSRLNISTQKMTPGAHELRFIGTEDGRMESRWEKAVWITVGGNNNQVTLKGPKTWKAADKKPLVVTVIGSDPKNAIEIFQDTKSIVRVAQGSNTCEVPVEKLGTGPVRLQAYEKVGTAYVASLPIVVSIE